MIKILMIFLLFIHFTRQNCGTGTLKCNSKNQSLVCDTTKLYKLNTTKQECEQVSISNCKSISLVGICLLCSGQFFVSDNICVAVTTEKQIDNCRTYDSSENCTHCNDNYLLTGSTCTVISIKIANCKYYDSQLTCISCLDNFSLDSERKTCVSVPSISNCIELAEYDCQSCNSGFILNKNLNQYTRFDFENDQKTMSAFDFIIRSENNSRSIVNWNVCQASDVPFCDEHVNFKECKTCKSGYFLTEEKKCQIFLIDKIPNCIVYQASNDCKKCDQGFVRSSATECTSITSEQSIQGCKNYDGTIKSVSCLECNPNYFKSGSSCTERTTTVLNCQVQSPTSNGQCQKCNSGKSLSSDSTFCGNSIENCKTHETDNLSDKTLKCSVCNQPYYFNTDTGKCVEGNIVHCENYEVNKNKCKKCENSYFLKDNLCHEHLKIENCDIYDQNQQNFCRLCDKNYFPVKYKTICKTYDVISSCKTQVSDQNSTKCEQCENGYKLDKFEQQDRCIVVLIENCYQEFAQKCTVCKENLGIDIENDVKAKGCVAGFDYVTSKCEEEELSDASNLEFYKMTCNVCAQNAIGVLINKNNVCIKNTYAPKLKKSLSLIDHCMIYYYSGTNYKCARCNQKYVKTTNGVTECVNLENCFDFANQQSKAIIPFNLLDGDIVIYESCSHKTGSTLESVFALSFALDLITFESDLISIACNGEWVKVVDFTDLKFSNVKPTGTFDSWVENVHDVYVSVDCPVFATTENKDKINGVIQGDAVMPSNTNYEYFKFVTDTYHAVKCKLGFTASGADTNLFLNQCNTAITDCDTNVTYRGLHPFWSKLLSCHKCNNDKVPVVVFMSTDKNTFDYVNYQKFNVDQAADFIYQEGDGAGTAITRCMTNTVDAIKSDFNLDLNNANVQVLPNCAFYYFNQNYAQASFNNNNVNLETGYNDDHNALLCGACLPGFKATFRDTTNQKIVVKCDAITNCAVTPASVLNRCEKCEDNYYFDKLNPYVSCNAELDGNSNPIADVNCRFHDLATKLCEVCDKGFRLNEDNRCDSITEYPNCVEESFHLFQLNMVNKIEYTDYFQKPPGCFNCGENHFALYMDSNSNGGSYSNKMCVTVDFGLTTKGTFDNLRDASTSKFVPNCLNYTSAFNSPGVCGKCKTGFMLDEQKTTCHDVTSFSNCVKIDTNCVQCENGYGLSNSNTCIQGNITNCSKYNDSTQQTTVKCEKCEDTYSLNTGTNSCVQGEIHKCKEYENNDVYACKICDINYWVLNGITSKELPNQANPVQARNACIPVDTYPKCKTVLFDKVLNHFWIPDDTLQLNCDSCEVNGFLYNVIDPSTVDSSKKDVISKCLPYFQITNCEKHFVGENQLVTDSNFTCIECSSRYYRTNKGKECKERTNKHAQCKTFSISEDTCSECNVGYYLAEQNKECHENPTGIVKCAAYSDKSTCTQCSTNYYLSENTCLAVIDPIENCITYQDKINCSKCNTGFTIKTLSPPNEQGHTNECEQGVENCIDHTSKLVCKTCLPNHQLIQNTSGTTTCTPFTKPNCLSFEQEGTNNCLQCEASYYIDNEGNCVQANISNCKQPQNDTLCEICSLGYALTSDKLSCIQSTFDNNCNNLQKPSQLVCSACQGGFFMNNGVCTPFTGQTYESGCFQQDHYDIAVCKVCRSGFYMQSDFTCVKEQIDPEVTPTTPSYSILYVLISISVLLFQII